MTDWHPPKDAKITIVCAACKISDGTIITGARHWDNTMFDVLLKLYPDQTERRKQISGEEQGFIDQWGRFYGREQAFNIVQENGQPFDAERNTVDGILYSEGLY